MTSRQRASRSGAAFGQKRRPSSDRPGNRDRRPPNPRPRLFLGIALVAALSAGVAAGGVVWASNASQPQHPLPARIVARPAPMPRVGEKAPDAWFHTARGRVALASLRGRKTMLWLLSTWCGSCAQGLRSLAVAEPKLARSGIAIVALRTYANDGYPGPTITQFVKRFEPRLLGAPNWTIGEASEELARRYNRRGYADIYFLIDSAGVIRAIDGAPSVTLDKILRFAGAAG